MKKRSIAFIFIVLIFGLFFSCNSKFDDLNYPGSIDKKKSEKPTASVLEENKQITISWNSHKNAHDYELYKDTSYDGAFTEKIYSGTNLSYKDSAINDNRFYFYKVKAVSDIVTYEPSDAATGLYSSTACAIKNTSMAGAPEMHKDVTCTVPFFTFYDTRDVKKAVSSYYCYTGDSSGL